MNCVTKKPFIFSVFAYKYYQLKKMNKRKLAVQYFGRSRTYLEDCLWLAGKTNSDCHITMVLSLKTMEVQIKVGLWNKRVRTVQVYWIFRMFSPRRYCRCRLVLRCPLSLPGALFLRFVLFSLRRCGVACPGRSALAQAVSELQVSSFRHAAWLNFAGFRSSGDFFAYRNPVIHNSLWHRRLAFTCRGSQLFSLLEVVGNNSCNSSLLTFYPI